jgi:anti-anti-sigma factor
MTCGSGTTVVAIDGEFDVSQRERLEQAFSAALGSSLVVLDLDRTLYFDSTVISCLMRLQTTMFDRGGRLVLVRVPRKVHRLLENCGLASLVDVRDSLCDVEEERAACGGGYRRLEVVAGTHH